MSETTISVPEHASGHLVYIGTDELDDVQGAMATIGAALHFAADHLEQFRDEMNAHNESHEGPGGPVPSVEAYRAILRFTHDLAIPGCTEPLP